MLTKMIKEHELSEKWWWRALKVAYILVWLAAFSLIGIIAFTNRPQTTQDSNEVIIKCESGKSYRHTLANYFFGREPNWSKEEVEQLKRLCAYGDNDTLDSPAIAENNFTYELAYNNYGSWESVLKVLGLGILISLFIIEGVKSIVLYILGIHVFRGMLWYIFIFIVGMFIKDGKKEE